MEIIGTSELHGELTASTFIASLCEAIEDLGLPGSLEAQQSNHVGRLLEELVAQLAKAEGDARSLFGE
jgi:hypothetical protein